MKTATLFFCTMLGVCFGLVSKACCPIYPIASIKVIDPLGNQIPGASVYTYSSAIDSFKLRNNFHYVSGERYVDTSEFTEYSRGGYFYRRRDNVKAADYRYRICAPGYADVLIKNVVFKSNDRDFKTPLLEVVLYAKQLIKTNEVFQVHDFFIIEHDLTVKDSFRLDKKDYLAEIQEAPLQAHINQVTVRTYPNPVVDELHIEFSNPQTSNNRFVLHDANGKLVHEQISDASKFDLLMNWYAPGTYFLTIYDSSNSPVLRQKLVHQ